MFGKFNLSLLLSFLSVALGPGLFTDKWEVASAPTTGLILVESGQARAVIVVAADVVERVESIGLEQAEPLSRIDKVAWAAKELRDYLGKIAGVKLPIVADAAAGDSGVRILVGRSALTAPFEGKIPQGLTPQREEEGALLLAEGQTLLLAGNDAGAYHGTEYAVCFFLHRLGVRWYLPGEFGEVVPQQATIQLEAFEQLERPDFKLRNWWTHWFADDLRPEETRWKIRNGMNPNTMHAVPGDSSVRAVLPPESEQDNPEFADVFARDAAGKTFPHMPNLASQRSVDYAAKRIKEHFRQNPEATSWGIGADDGLPRDFSAGAAELHQNLPSLIGRFNDPGGDSTTEEWMQWIHRVSREVRQEFPNHFLSTNGYANRDTPPLFSDADASVWIMFAAIWSNSYQSLDNPRNWMNRRHQNMLWTWTSRYRNVYLYDYLYYNLVGCGSPPVPLSRRHARNMPLLKKMGVVGFWNEGRTVRGEAGIFPTWILARLMWDADLYVAAAEAEYYRLWYGSAAETAHSFWDAMEDALETGAVGGNRDNLLSLAYTPQLVQRLGELLKIAERDAASDPRAASHVKLDRATYDYLVGYKQMEAAEAAADWIAAIQAADAMVEAIRPAEQLSRHYFDVAEEDKPRKGQAYGFYYWGTGHRRDAYQQLSVLTDGSKGKLLTILPETAKFASDPRDDGRFDGWFRADWSVKDWETMKTTVPFFAQGERGRYLDDQGFPYLGAMWYRLEVEVPTLQSGQKVRLHGLAVETEAWVWVNGEFVGNRPYQEAYLRPNSLDLDVTNTIRGGERNAIVIRVHTNYQPAQMSGGLVSRLFLYTPKD